MKRKATRFLALAMSAVLVTSLTACGDGSDENAKDAVTPVEAQPMLSEPGAGDSQSGDKI